MKKILFSLVVIIFTLFAFNQADAQCNKCIYPKLCRVVTVNIPNCGNVNFTVCYQCMVTQKSLMVELVEWDTDCINNPFVLKYFYEWLSDHLDEFCGQVPCDQDRYKVTITTPICADVFWDGSRLIFTPNLTDCYSLCVKEYEWCRCNCTPDCITPNCVMGQKSWKLNEYYIGNGTCTNTHIYQNQIQNQPWTESEKCLVNECQGLIR